MHASARPRYYAWLRTLGTRLALVALTGALASCASLPVSGPTGSQIVRQSNEPNASLPFHVVEMTSLAELPLPDVQPALAAATPAPPTDLIGPGDVLDIEIYEAGVTLFAGSRSGASDGASNSSGAAQAEHLPPLRVDDLGRINVPYVGELRATGRTTGELAASIRNGLHGISQAPQVVVTITDNIAGGVIIGGEVGKPGRLALVSEPETLSDVIALAGGYRGDAKDLVARVTREGDSYDYRLADVLNGPAHDMQVTPGDRIEVVRAPLSFSVLGAAGRIDVVPFASPKVSLIEAVAAAGGAHPNLGDAKAVFVFRFVTTPDGAFTPTVYHLDMMHASAYFLGQRFVMRDKDVLYVGNAASNQPSKLIQLISQLFSPIVAVESGLISTGAIK